MRTFFERVLEALEALPVQMALVRKALGLKETQESPPPRDPRPDHFRRRYPPKSDVALALTAARPRDRKLKVERTWKGKGRQGEGEKGEEERP